MMDFELVKSVMRIRKRAEGLGIAGVVTAAAFLLVPPVGMLPLPRALLLVACGAAAVWLLVVACWLLLSLDETLLRVERALMPDGRRAIAEELERADAKAAELRRRLAADEPRHPPQGGSGLIAVDRDQAVADNIDALRSMARPGNVPRPPPTSAPGSGVSRKLR